MDRKIEIFIRSTKEAEYTFLAFGRLTDMYDIHDAGPLPHWVTREFSRSLWAHQNQTFVELTLGNTQYRVEVGPPIIEDFFVGCEGVHLGSRSTGPCEICGSVAESYEYSTEAEGIYLDGIICGSCYAFSELDKRLHRDGLDRD